MQVTLTPDPAKGRIRVTCASDPGTEARLREAKGVHRRGVWWMEDRPAVRRLLRELFGARSPDVYALVPASLLEDGPVVRIGGYALAKRSRKDAPAELFAGVRLLNGSLPAAAGTKRYPKVGLQADCEFALRCRKSFAVDRGLDILYEPPVDDL